MSMKKYRPPEPPPPEPARLPGQYAATADGEFLFNAMLTVHKLPSEAAATKIRELKAAGNPGPFQVPDESMDICLRFTVLMARPSPLTNTGEVWPVDGPIVARFPLQQLLVGWAAQKAAQSEPKGDAGG